MKENPFFTASMVLVTVAGLLMVASGIFASQEAQISAIKFSALGDAIYSYEKCVDNSTSYDKTWFCSTAEKLIDVSNDDQSRRCAHSYFVFNFYSASLVACFALFSFIGGVWFEKRKK